jgi:hypothetical protein
VDECFARVASSGSPAVFSYFSHDNRDMRSETVHAVELLRTAAERTGVAWRSCTAVEAHRRYHGLAPERIALEIDESDGELRFRADAPPFQRVPFVGAQSSDGRFLRLFPKPASDTEWRLSVRTGELAQVAAAVTARSGDVTVATA